MLNEASIRCFLTLAKTLNFTETARLTYMSQQSVSKYIAKLEGELGFQLFIRTHHYVLLTPAGENFYRLFQHCEEQYQATLAETRRYDQEKSNTIRIGYLEWLKLAEPIAQGIAVVQGEMPELRVQVERRPQYELNRRFLDRHLDVIITYPDLLPKQSGVQKKSLLEIPKVLLVSPNHPKVRPGAVAADFRTEPLIKVGVNRKNLEESQNQARRQAREMGLAPSKIMILPNVESAYVAASLGRGVLISNPLSASSLESKLVAYPVNQKETLVCCWREDAVLPDFSVALKENVKQQFQTLCPE